MEIFHCNYCKIVVKPTIHQNSAVSKHGDISPYSKAFWENFKITDHKLRF